MIRLKTETYNSVVNFGTIHWDGSTLKYNDEEFGISDEVSITGYSTGTSISSPPRGVLEYIGKSSGAEFSIEISTSEGSIFNVFNNSSTDLILILNSPSSPPNKFTVQPSQVLNITSKGSLLTASNFYLTTSSYTFSDAEVKSSATGRVGGIIDNSGKTWAWGYNIDGGVGSGSSEIILDYPSLVCGNHTFCKLYALETSMVGIDDSGQAWAWGWGIMTGSNTLSDKCTPVQVCGNHTFCSMAIADGVVIALDENGQAWAWGQNGYGELGNNSTTTVCTPVQVCGNHTFCQVDAGERHILALDESNNLWFWGASYYGESGTGTVGLCTCTPIQVTVSQTFQKIAAGRFVSYGIEASGAMWSWGGNFSFQLGDNSTTDRSTPVQVCGGHTFCDVRCGLSVTYAIDSDGNAWVWGDGDSGNLGTGGSFDHHCTPVAMLLPSTKMIVPLYDGGIAVDYDNQLWVWGDTTTGVLGYTENCNSILDPEIHPFDI